jgi:hypothetical protein
VLQQELQLKLARKCLHACGISLFDLEKDLHIISKMNKKKKKEKKPFPLILVSDSLLL